MLSPQLIRLLRNGKTLITPAISSPNLIPNLQFWYNDLSINNIIENPNLTSLREYSAYVNGQDNILPILTFQNEEITVTPIGLSAHFGITQNLILTAGQYTITFSAKSTNTTQPINILIGATSNTVNITNVWQEYTFAVSLTGNSSFFFRSTDEFTFSIRFISARLANSKIFKLTNLGANKDAILQSTVALQPTTLNDKIVQFNGSEMMELPISLRNLLSNGNSTLIIYAKTNNVTANGQRLITVNNSGNSSVYNFQFVATNQNWNSKYNDINNQALELTSNVTINNTSYYTLSRIDTTNTASLYINTALQDSKTMASFANNAGTLGALNSTNFWTGEIKEILVYSRALTYTELEQINNWLTNKHN